MIHTTLRALRAMAFAALLALVPGLVALGISRGWGLAEWEVALGLSGITLVALLVLALGGKVGMGHSRPGISGDEIGRQG